ncbi:MAG TPA: hypothetical protein VKB51_12800 [bacterium]|nr:hypothetical protein [bacterium]
MAALIYPIVIAFVVLFLQQKGHNAKSTLHIYLHDSAAIFSGLSSIGLLILMGMQYLVLPTLNVEIIIGWVLADTAWFLGNVALTSFFVVRTFAFVQPDQRAETIRRHVIDVIWPRELGEYLASYFFVHAVREGLLPGAPYGAQDSEHVPSIGLGSMLAGMGAPIIEHLRSQDSRLREVRFRILGAAIRLWLRRASSDFRDETGTRHAGAFGIPEATPALFFPIDPSLSYSGDTVLCAIAGEVCPSWVEKFLISCSFSFSKKIPDAGVTTSEVLESLSSEAMEAMHSGSAQAFSDSVDELAELYRLLIVASETKSGETSQFNYAMLLRRQSFMEREIHEIWERSVVDLFSAAARNVSVSDEYARDLIYVPLRLFLQLREIAHSKILENVVNLPPKFHFNLISWWSKVIEQQGDVEHDVCHSVDLRPPYFPIYDSLLREFVGQWEEMRDAPFMGRRDFSQTWPVLCNRGRYLETHLRATARMVIRSAFVGDGVGARWIVDVLMKWFSDFYLRRDAHSYLFRSQEMLSFELSQLEWSEIQSRYHLESGQPAADQAPRELFAIILRNYRVDVCLVVAYLLVLLGKDCDCERSLAARLLKTILFTEGRGVDENAADAEPAVRSANDFIAAILRQYHGQGGYRRGYRSRLDSLVQSLVSVTKDPGVPGRVYSRWGADDLSSLRDGQLVLLLILVPSVWNPLQKIERILRGWVGQEDERLRELGEQLQGWKDRLGSDGFADYESIYNCLKGDSPDPAFGGAVDRVRDGLDQIMRKVDEIRTEAVVAQDVSSVRLAEIGRWTSARAFSKESAAFPVSLFRVVGTSDKELNPRHLVLRELAKGEYTEPPMAQRPGNEEEFFGEMLRDRVAAFILAEVIDRLNPQDRDGRTPEKYWEQIKRYRDDAVREGKQPILLVENGATPEWIFEWTNPWPESPRGIPPDLEAWRNAERAVDAYLGNLNEVEVYSALLPPGASLLISAESLRAITFSRLEDGNYVRAEALPIEEKPTSINLSLTWWFEIDLDPYPAVRLVYS